MNIKYQRHNSQLIFSQTENHTDLDIVELAMDGPATEVHIPVLNVIDEIPSPTVAVTLNQQSNTPQTVPALPTIAITKPPAPLPVALPTALDIASVSSPDSDQFDDIESGRIRESEDVGLVTSTRKTRNDKSPIRRETSDTSGSALPLPPTPLEPAPEPLASTSSLPPIVPDLLADEPLETLSSMPEVDNAAYVVGLEEDEPIPDTTIRLVGGGGQAGIASPTSVEPEEPEPAQPVEPVVAAAVSQDSDVASVNSVTSSSETGKKGHKKSKSSLALKRLSQLGGKRKKSDSVSSAKEVAPPSVK